MYRCMMKKKKKKAQIFKTEELFPGVVPADGSARTHNAMLVDLYKLRATLLRLLTAVQISAAALHCRE